MPRLAGIREIRSFYGIAGSQVPQRQKPRMGPGHLVSGLPILNGIWDSLTPP